MIQKHFGMILHKKYLSLITVNLCKSFNIQTLLKIQDL